MNTIKGIALDLTGMAGVGVTAYGLHLIYNPLAFIFVGIMLLFYAIVGARTATRAATNNKRNP